MNKPVILINGTGGCGKDTFIDFCKDLAACRNISTVDRVKEAGRMLGWEGAKTDRDRKFLSDLKKLAVQYSDHAFRYIVREIDSFLHDNLYDILFFHSREPEEIKRFKNIGCSTLLITNSNVEIIKSNYSDGNVLNFDYDYVIDNSGSPEELRLKAHEFVRLLMGGDHS